MVEDTHVLDSLPAYALGCLDEDEDRLVSEHIASCYLCRTELDSFQAVADGLALAVPIATPPVDLKQRLVERVRGLDPALPPTQGIRKPLFQRLLPAGGIVSLLAILALAVAFVLLWQRMEQLAVLTGPQGMRAIALQSSGVAPHSSGFVIIGADGLNGVLVVDRMPPLAQGREYQLWLERDGQSTSGGVFPVDESGYRGMRIAAPESLFEYKTVRVTIEPAGSAVPTEAGGSF
jgi:anti-sigma-K factor RskA